GLTAAERGGRLVFSRDGARGERAIELTELVAEDDQPVVETTREPATMLPGAATLSFRDPLNDHQVATAFKRRPDGGRHEAALGFPGVLDGEQAGGLLEGWLARQSVERQTLTFRVATPDPDVLPGALVSLPEVLGAATFVVTEIEDGSVRRVSARQTAAAAP